MARDWRRAMLAAFAAAVLGCACALGAFAQPAEEEPQEDEKAATDAKAKKKQDPAEAQRTIEAALQQLQAGKAAQALQAVSATVAGGNLPPAIMAKALYVRGMAYRRQGRPAQAISDLTSALWLKGGLGGDEREEAMKEGSAAYADAGLADPGESRPAPKTKIGGQRQHLAGRHLRRVGRIAGDSQPCPGTEGLTGAGRAGGAAALPTQGLQRRRRPSGARGRARRTCRSRRRKPNLPKRRLPSRRLSRPHRRQRLRPSWRAATSCNWPRCERRRRPRPSLPRPSVSTAPCWPPAARASTGPRSATWGRSILCALGRSQARRRPRRCARGSRAAASTACR